MPLLQHLNDPPLVDDALVPSAVQMRVQMGCTHMHLTQLTKPLRAVLVFNTLILHETRTGSLSKALCENSIPITPLSRRHVLATPTPRISFVTRTDT